MKKVLIVDDQKECILIMKMILKQFPIKIIEACNGEEALKKIRKYQPALAFLDIRMPMKNGIDVLKELQEQGDKTAIVMVSDHRDEAIIDACFDLGAMAYLKKPFSLRELNNVIKKLNLSDDDGKQESTSDDNVEKWDKENSKTDGHIH
ncbi:MAG: response regulator [Marinilabiliaceae bacterium]|nr:response regulator [Marinilabiliaceae bacterium]